MSTGLIKATGRILVAMTAVSVILTTTGVTAFAATTDNIVVTTSSRGEDSLAVILPQAQQRELGEAVLSTLSASDRATVESGTPLDIILSAKLLDKASDQSRAAAAPLLGDKQPELVFRLSLYRQLEGGNSVAVTELDRSIAVTVTLPELLVGSEKYSIVTTRDGRAAVTADTDSVPNTITFMVGGMPTVMVVRGEVLAPAAPAVPTAPTTAPTTPAAKPANPTAGGVDTDYLPRSILAQAVPISIPISVAVTPMSTFCESMAGTSMFMTAAFVGGAIDYENSEQEEGQEDDEEQGTEAEVQDDDDVEDFIESFENTDYSHDLNDEHTDHDDEKYI